MRKIYNKIKKCRICGNRDLLPILKLGNQFLTGIFPKTKEQFIPSGPLELVKCNNNGNNRSQNCGLVQLKHSYVLNKLYGENYGYRSGLNQSMVYHLQQKVKKILGMDIIKSGDLIIDIGSNDGTLLKAYPSNKKLILAGIDPTGKKFTKYYPQHIHLIANFFSAKLVKKYFGNKKAKVITSIAMFYDLEEPIKFMEEIKEILDDRGVWIFEQSYLPSMLELTAYDTICHEHLEYYGLSQIKWMTDKVGLEIVDVELNKANGGSFSVSVVKVNAKRNKHNNLVKKLLRKEKEMKLYSLRPYLDFKKRIFRHRDKLQHVVKKLKEKHKSIFGYGASTKGNVILQFCHFTKKDIPYFAEVNEDKFGCFTPGTKIPIISEKEAKSLQPQYLLVMPWHFKDNIIMREKQYLAKDGKLLFPLPEIEVIKLK